MRVRDAGSIEAVDQAVSDEAHAGPAVPILYSISHSFSLSRESSERRDRRHVPGRPALPSFIGTTAADERSVKQENAGPGHIKGRST